jgi:CBS domain-containing protein
MNIAFFLIPKKEIVFLSDDSTMRQALERMEYHQYTAVPVLNNEGKYVGTITEGDLLWKLKNTTGLTFDTTHKVPLKDIPQRIKNETVRIDAQIEDLVSLAVFQNFVPVIDDNGVFVGIIRRREIIDYCLKRIIKN